MLDLSNRFTSFRIGQTNFWDKLKWLYHLTVPVSIIKKFDRWSRGKLTDWQSNLCFLNRSNLIIILCAHMLPWDAIAERLFRLSSRTHNSDLTSSKKQPWSINNRLVSLEFLYLNSSLAKISHLSNNCGSGNLFSYYHIIIRY